MSRLIQLQTHPFRLLLYLEWILLGITIVLPPAPWHANVVPLSWLLTILSLTTFGVMGLRLPKGGLLPKVLYTGIGFGLVLLAAVARGRGVSLSPSLLLILVIRSCLIFGLTGRLLVAGLAFIAVLLTLFLQVHHREHVTFASPHFVPLRYHPLTPSPKCGRRGTGSHSSPLAFLGRGAGGVSPTARSAGKGSICKPDMLPHHRPKPRPRPNEQVPISRLAPRGAPTPIPATPETSETSKSILIALLFGLVLLFVLLLVNALLAERQSRQQLAIANEQLRQYSQRIEDQATLQERNRIAREIHDSLGHSLTAQSIQLENALMFLQSNVDKAQGFLQEAQKLGKNALQEVRQSIATLRSNPLQGKSLEDAMASLLDDFHRTTGIVPEWKINLSFAVPDSTIKLSLALPAEVSTAIYRITKEALTNIYKHSEATQVKIRLQANVEVLSLLVEDNGRGFHPDENTTGFGLKGMRERTVALGGQFNIISELGTGCRITVYIPLPTLYPYP